MEIIDRTINAIKQITVPRYFASERGFAGEFYCQLKNQNVLDLYGDHAIIETEVQKRVNEHYGVRQRPDILIHVPIETGIAQNAYENNFVVYAFKLGGGDQQAYEDFLKMDDMFNHLRYEVGIFININAPKIYLNLYNGNYKDRIHELAVKLQDGNVLIEHAWFENGVVRQKNE